MENTDHTGLFVDIFGEKIFPATVAVKHGRVAAITPLPPDSLIGEGFLLPGFIDSHVHIESSMLIPSEFARLAVVHGTVGTVSDPHEIANVCGMDGIEFMIRNGQTVPFHFLFGAPSCVPATAFETAGAIIDAHMVEKLLQREEIGYLSEMMNFPGVLNGEEEVMAKIRAARLAGKPVDGHAPGLRGTAAEQYIRAGISTDHECFSAEEAVDKLRMGMKVLIREGSAARNFDALIHLLQDHADAMMFCSDDKHPDSLVAGHINLLCARAVRSGIPVMKVLKAACINPVLHYKMSAGLLQVGHQADFIRVKDLESFEVMQTFIGGRKVAENGQSLIQGKQETSPCINHFNCLPLHPDDFGYFPDDITLVDGKLPVIGAADGQLITAFLKETPVIDNGKYMSDTNRDLIKIVVVNRYRDAPVAKGFIRHTGLKSGAIASSVAHDSHNIVAIGVDDESLCRAVNLVVTKKGGISIANRDLEEVLPLPVAGLMSGDDGYSVAAAYTRMDQLAKQAGSTLQAPFMTLSFMALLVIPSLKISDLGLFDGNLFRLVKAASPVE